ncbi:phenylacetate-CoA oxygenase [beta proteobacterium AAP121]|nr:phenylacetate-CoA oxygenase [beta proteobacterium AAP65]KPF98025.1 phenylacetate-CoA oxygenase [beta proteobacterium AAP121]
MVSEAEGLQGDSLHPRELAAWAVLRTVPDPEIPVLGLCDLGIVREVLPLAPTLRVVLTPTYSGCPATEVIAQSVVQALDAAGLGPTEVVHRHAPAWTTDWISVEGRRKLRAYGIAPPGACASEQTASGTAVLRLRPRNVECPRCGSFETERLSAFGSTACKALHRCLACREPFEHFKPI